MGIRTQLAMAAGATALLLNACSAKEDPNKFCARDGDGQLVATTDGKNFSPLAAGWVEGTEGWNRTPICALTQGSAPPEMIMPLKELPQNATVRVAPEPGF